MRHGQHRRSRMHRNRRAAGLVDASRTGRRARTFRKYDDPEPVLKPVFALREHLFQRPHAGAAVDRNRRHHGKSPAKNGIHRSSRLIT